MKKELTANQLQAIRIFAKTHGRRWKAQLRDRWEHESGANPELLSLRNTHGPSWLVKFKLK